MSLIAISAHVKDKSTICTARGEDIIFFSKWKNFGISSVSI